MPPPAAVGSQAVLIALMLAHGVELDDSLVSASRWSIGEGTATCLSAALASYAALKGLAHHGVVSFVPDPRGPHGAGPAQIVHEGANDRDFRRAFVELVGEVFPNEAPDEDRRKAPTNEHDFTSWYLSALEVTLLSEMLDDLAIIDRATTYSPASAWFPSREHLRMLSLLSSAGARMPAGVVDAAVGARLLEVSVPLFDLQPDAVIELRRSSDVLERWRSALKEALASLDQLPLGSDVETERAEIERAMKGHATRFAKDASSEFSPVVVAGKSVKTLGFGLLGGLAGGLASHSFLGAVLYAVVSGGARAAADAVSDITTAAPKRAALSAAREHALVFSASR